MENVRRRFLDGLRLPAGGALAAAFAAVPREAFLTDGFHRRDGSRVRPGDPDFLDLVHTDDALVTKYDNHRPVSSSSQPSLMAAMLVALDVRPGMHVLEIGAGTGYNAALLAALGCTVTTVDSQADVADQARKAVAAAGVAGVEVVHGDGYAGIPRAHVDRVIVTVGVAGLSPRWLNQVGDGVIVAPVLHAGTHPVLAVRTGDEGVPEAEPVCPAGFMPASGPLGAISPWSHPPPAGPGELGELEPAAPPRWTAADAVAYRDLWFAAGVWHRRATYAAVPGSWQGDLVLLDEDRSGGALIEPDGTVRAGGAQAARYAADAVAVLDRWEREGRPRMTSWIGELNLGGHSDAPIWIPYDWQVRHQVPARRSRQGRPSGS